MKTAWIAFEKDDSFSGWIVRKVSGYEYNHVAVVYQSADFDNLWATEAVTSGVRAKPLSPKRKFPLIYKAKFDMTPDVKVALEMIGEPYDYAGLFVFGLFLLAWRWLKTKWKMPKVTFKGQMCSEYVARILNNKYGMFFADPQWVKPADIEAFCDNRVEDFEEVTEFQP